MTDCHIQTAAGWYIHQHLYIEGAYSFHNGQFFFFKTPSFDKKKTKQKKSKPVVSGPQFFTARSLFTRPGHPHIIIMNRPL